MVSAINAALTGLFTAGKKLQDSATNIANSGNSSQAVPKTDMAKDMVDMKISANEFEANLKTIKVAGDMEKSLLDIIT